MFNAKVCVIIYLPGVNVMKMLTELAPDGPHWFKTVFGWVLRRLSKLTASW